MNPKSSNLPVITASHQKYNCYPMTNVPKSKNKFYQANNQTFKTRNNNQKDSHMY